MLFSDRLQSEKLGSAPSGRMGDWGAAYLALKRQAIQMSPFQGEGSGSFQKHPDWFSSRIPLTSLVGALLRLLFLADGVNFQSIDTILKASLIKLRLITSPLNPRNDIFSVFLGSTCSEYYRD